MDVHTYSDRDRVDTLGPVTVFGWRPRASFLVDPTIPQDARHFFSDRRVIAAARSRGYDVVNVVAPGTMGWQGLDVARQLGLPVVAMYTTCLPEYAGKRTARVVGRWGSTGSAAVRATEWVGWRLMKRFYHRRNGVRTVLAPTQRTADEIEPRLDAPIRILGRGVDTDLFQPREGGERDVRRPPVILFCGRLHRGEKGLDTYVDLADSIKDVRFLIVGDGPHRASLERDLEGRAKFTGALAGEALADAYRRADLFVFPSKHDTFGQVVMEAMATGLPVVVTDHGGPQELVEDGVTGFIASDGDFIDRVRDLAESPELRRRLGKHARQAAERRSWTEIFRTLWGYYREAVVSTSGKTERARVTV